MRDITLKRTLLYMGEDILITLYGGAAHIGSHVTALPYERDGSWHVTLQTWNKLAHKDDVLAAMYAKEMALLSHHTVVCICGVHFDAITVQEIDAVKAWCKQDIEAMRKEYRKHEGSL